MRLPNLSGLRPLIAEAFFRDHARPVEWISLLALTGWLQFLVTSPDAFAQDRYQAFHALPPEIWALIITAIIAAQLGAMWPNGRTSTIRWLAMTMAAAIWAVIAANFWAMADTAPISARTSTVLAASVAATAIYLGLQRR